MKTDIRITQYIEKAQPFAQPILNEIRRRVHEYCPQVEEGWKWSFPNFMLNGRILCSMASFKNHCSFGFWLAPLMNNEGFKREGMGDLGKMTSMDDLPDEDLFKAMLFEAVELTLAGKTIQKSPPAKTGNFEESAELLTALKKNPAAQLAYEKFSNSHRKEYNEWILEAKTEATRDKRIGQAIEWMTEGKHRHWKYVKN
ncbi:MAG: hypothetical protein K0R65_841 [Crocinitomicaceae bacterium]|jgi:hypothetical protein|nr:hypothetical protein [Crocinitomicaceae bacterium]